MIFLNRYMEASKPKSVNSVKNTSLSVLTQFILKLMGILRLYPVYRLRS